MAKKAAKPKSVGMVEFDATVLQALNGYGVFVAQEEKDDCPYPKAPEFVHRLWHLVATMMTAVDERVELTWRAVDDADTKFSLAELRDDFRQEAERLRQLVTKANRICTDYYLAEARKDLRPKD